MALWHPPSLVSIINYRDNPHKHPLLISIDPILKLILFDPAPGAMNYDKQLESENWTVLTKISGL